MARFDLSPVARLLTSAAVIEPTETKAVLLSFVNFACLMASDFILRPVRDAMGTVYGVRHLQESFTGTFLLNLSGDRLGTRGIEDPHRVGGSPAP